jgi:hypothetical protein
MDFGPTALEVQNAERVMLPEDQQRMMLAYLASLQRGLKLGSMADLIALSSREILLLARKIDDPALGLFVQLLKSTEQGTALFEKLMGDHEEDNRPLVDEFFSRYLKSVSKPNCGKGIAIWGFPKRQ